MTIPGLGEREKETRYTDEHAGDFSTLGVGEHQPAEATIVVPKAPGPRAAGPTPLCPQLRRVGGRPGGACLKSALPAAQEASRRQVWPSVPSEGGQLRGVLLAPDWWSHSIQALALCYRVTNMLEGQQAFWEGDPVWFFVPANGTFASVGLSHPHPVRSSCPLSA